MNLVAYLQDNKYKHKLEEAANNLIIEIGLDYNLTAIRIPNEPPLESITKNKKEFIKRYLRWLFFTIFTSSMKRKCKKNQQIF